VDVLKEEPRQPIEPQFLSQAQATGTLLRIGQMNKVEHEGSVTDVGRYEININEKGKTITILKQDISFLSAPHPLLTIAPLPSDQTVSGEPGEPLPGRPNIQQTFLDKAIRENQLLTLFLINGQRVKATIEAYDNFTILLREGDRQHLYYKHSITTINR
jgi:host factor-I protein